MSNSRLRLCAALIVLPCLFQATPAVAEAGANLAPEDRLMVELADQVDALEERDRRIVQSQGPSESFGFAPLTPLFQFTTDQADGEVSLSLAAELGRTRRNYDPTSGDDRRMSWTSRLYLRGFAPIDEDDEDADLFVNLAEPLDGARITLGFVHYFSRYTLRREDLLRNREIRTEVIGDCVQQAVAVWRGGPRSAEQVDLVDAYLAAYRTNLQADQRPEPALAQTNSDTRFTALPPEVKDRCLSGQEGSEGDMLAIIRRYGTPALSEELLRTVSGDAPTYFFGAEATVSQKEFSFLDRTAFTIDDESHRGYALSAFAGMISSDGVWSMRAGITYSRAYEGEDPITLCRPVADTTDTQCLTGADGPPTRSSNTVISLEGRRRFHTPLGDIGVAPVLAINPDDGEFTVDMPIYLARNDDGQLTGGVRIGYASEEDDISFGFFVGVPFNNFLK